MKNSFIALSKINRTNKIAVMALTDLILIYFVLVVSFSLRFNEVYFPNEVKIWFTLFLISPIIALPVFFHFGLYSSMVRFLGLKNIWSILKATSLYSLIWGVLALMTTAENLIPGIPRSVIIVNWLLTFLSIASIRLFARWLIADSKEKVSKNIVIYGAGESGRQLSLALLHSSQFKQIAFIDDNLDFQGRTINGFKIIHQKKFSKIISNVKVDEVLLALPSITRFRRSQIIQLLESHSVAVRSIPGLSDLAAGSLKIEDLREISIKDLLGRDTVKPEINLLAKNIANKNVMITGAGGSIGSEICRQVLSLKPKRIILFENSEFSLYQIEKELNDNNDNNDNIEIFPILGSIKNSNRVERVLDKFNVQTIYHAAAYKHVPMVEFNNTEGINNNIFGTLIISQLAVKYKVEAFVLISTDKAVRPTNTMGVTKRLAELILQSLSTQKHQTRFTIVRFGNVLGSSGSVIPLFKKQIKAGGPLTVTDPDMIRYFMTIPEAVELVIQAGSMGDGGDVFVLDMGEPVSILNLAKKMIYLSGLQLKNELNPNGDIEIKYTGLRPGEKLYEELLIGNNTTLTQHSMIMRAKEKMIPWLELSDILENLEQACNKNDHFLMRKLLEDAVPDFIPQCEISDLLYKKNRL
jgi:FlaA1/EpsC-like NDP-sugar epimerase